MAAIRFQSTSQAARERELIKNPRPFAPRTAIKVGTMQATAYPITGVVLFKMDTGQSISLSREESMALRDLLVAELPLVGSTEEDNAH